MPDDIVTAQSVSIFKGCFDKKYAYLQYRTDIDYVTEWEIGLQTETTGPTACMDRKMMMMMIRNTRMGFFMD